MLGYFGLLSYRSIFSGTPRFTVAAAPRASSTALAVVPSSTPAEATAAATLKTEQSSAVTTPPATAASTVNDAQRVAREPMVQVPRPSSVAAPGPSPRVLAPSAGSTKASGDWAKAQADVRAALSAWLMTSGFGDDSTAADAVVILDVDGRIARTHIPMRWGGSAVTREQVWQRSTDGWSFVSDRQLSSD